MSEQAPERQPEQAPRQSGNVFMRKLGPLPLWAWMGVGLGVALAYSLWKKNKASASSASSGGTSSGGTTPASGTPSSLIPQFVNQVYNQAAPPPDVTVNNNQTVTSPPSPPVKPGKPPPKPPPPSGNSAPSDFEGWKTSGTSIHLHWSPLVPSPRGYTWVVKDKEGHTKTGTTSGTEVDVNGLRRNTGYSIGVYGITHNGTPGTPVYEYVST